MYMLCIHVDYYNVHVHVCQYVIKIANTYTNTVAMQRDAASRECLFCSLSVTMSMCDVISR